MKKHAFSLSLILLLLLLFVSTLALAEDPSQENTAYYQLGEKDTEDNTEISALQEALIDLGYLAEGAADGQYGKGTTAAVNQFQRDNNLNATGSVTYDQFRDILDAAEKVKLERNTQSIIDQINAIHDKDALQAILNAVLEKTNKKQ